MARYADLVITLSKQSVDSYWIEQRFSRPDDKLETSLEHAPAMLDFAGLLESVLDPRAHGQLLSKALFNDEHLGSYFNEALAVTQTEGLSLRLRLLVDRSAPELHELKWETLTNPKDGSFLAGNQNLLFSRYLLSPDWGQVTLHSRGRLKVLLMIASPSDLADYGMAEVQVDQELERSRSTLQGLAALDELVSAPAGSTPAGLVELGARLNLGYDLLYLVCHGTLKDGQPYLWLEGADGKVKRAAGQDLVELIANLPPEKRPRLVVLTACQSGGTGDLTGWSSTDQGALAALGPRLAQVGIPAVLAMQSNISMDTVSLFMPVFFNELLKNGQVDRAMAAARSQVLLNGNPDWWAPALYLRLRGGSLWYEPGFAIQDPEFDSWGGIYNSIRHGLCVPILGFGLLEFLAGSPRQIARDWAKENNYPLEPHNQDDLAQVAQYLAIRQGWAFPRDELLSYLHDRLLEEHSQILTPEEKALELTELIAVIGKRRREQEPHEAYSTLASLPFPIYITANPDSLLEKALEDAGKQPLVRYSRWNPRLITPQAVLEKDQPLAISPQTPLVYHLFGVLEDRHSLLVSEDDYFEFMMWVNNPSAPLPLPNEVLGAWRLDSLLFLGFEMSEWSFRVLFRSILNTERRNQERDYKSVAVQLQPGDDNLNPERARGYLEKFFREDKLEIYWGSADDFLSELGGQWQQRAVQ